MSLLLLLLILLSDDAAAAKNVYVSPTGDDSHSGMSPSTALRTLGKAKSLAGAGDTVHVSDGAYALSETLNLGQADAGVAWVAKEGGAVVSGGFTAGPWKAVVVAPTAAVSSTAFLRMDNSGCAADHCGQRSCPVCCGQHGSPATGSHVCPLDKPWCAGYVYMKHYGACSATRPPAPKALTVVMADVSTLGGRAQSRHLYVHGQRARRARLPPEVAESVFRGAKLTADGYTLAPAANGSIIQKGAEFVFPQSTSPWTEPRCAVASANRSSITMEQPCWNNLYHKACGQGVKGPPTGRGGYVENAGRDFVLVEGDFALVGGKLYYALRATESAATLQAVMPGLETLVNISANDVSFTGFSFQHATWLRPGQSDGYVEQQTGACTLGTSPNDNICTKDYFWSFKSPGNIAVVNATGVSFNQCEFTRLGGTALDFTSSSSCLVESCYFHDVSGAAVQIGSFQDPLGSKRDSNNTVRNTIINKAGAEYSGAAGINVGYTVGTLLLHNDVSNMSYVPISVGWGWSRHECGSCTNAAENHILHNRVHDYKQTLNDGGGIYMLGPQNNSEIAHNWVYKQHTASSGALYPDEGSAYSVWHHNVVTDIGRSQWLHLWTGSIHNVTVFNNFADTHTALNHGTNCPMMNNTVFPPGQPPADAVAIQNKSGVNNSNPWFSTIAH
jgi:hypothetical protein